MKQVTRKCHVKNGNLINLKPFPVEGVEREELAEEGHTRKMVYILGGMETHVKVCLWNGTRVMFEHRKFLE